MKLIQEKSFEEFQLVNPNGGKQYAGISERDVTARELEVTDKTGKKVKVWKLYANNTHIASIDELGRVKLTDEYKELLKSEKSIGPDGKVLVGERWLQAMVPLKDRFSGKDIDDMQNRKAIERINMEQRIKQEQEMEQERVQGVRSNTLNSKQKESGSKEQNGGPVISKQVPKPQKIEQDLGLDSGDIESCTVIRDKRFYDNIVEARVAQGLSVLAYSRSKNVFFVVSIDENGNCEKLDSIKSSKLTTDTTSQVKDGKVQETAVQNIMEVKGNDEIAYSVRINPGSSELELSELRRDLTQEGQNKYISTELETTTQRPTREEAETFRKENNPEITDEVAIIEEYKRAGVEVTKVESITREKRLENGILTMAQVEQKIKDKPEEVQEAVRQELQGREAHTITENVIEAMIKQKQQEIEEQGEERTPWRDAEAREARQRH